jgi:ribosomal-protein-alanine N-acetyltransferase
MHLLTERLRLDPIAHQDGAELLALFRAPEVRRYLLDDRLVDAGWIYSEVESSRHRFQLGAVGLFAVRERKTRGEIAGIAGMRPYKPGELQLLYALAPACGGKGLATEMLQAVVDFAFDVADLPKVRASIDAPNAASIKLVERLGFRLVEREPGERFELLIYDLTPGERKYA